MELSFEQFKRIVYNNNYSEIKFNKIFYEKLHSVLKFIQDSQKRTIKFIGRRLAHWFNLNFDVVQRHKFNWEICI
jgi:hypothetical protein